jgi:glucose/arabinose dehydrogenase
MSARSAFFPILLLLASAAQAQAVHLADAFPGQAFDRPVFLTYAPGGGGRLFVVQQGGSIAVIPPGGKASVFLDIRGRVRTEHPEEGLLCLAFDPHFQEDHFFYVIYSVLGADPRRTRLSRFEAPAANGDSADPQSEKTIFEVTKRYGNHNGSTLLFGRDGFLYFGLGDGGGGGDQDGNAQNLAVLLGKILRLDVDHPDQGSAYAIPSGNPFVGRPGARPEIWAYGLRNPWRMSFDRGTGDLWVGDVGQDKWEEVDKVKRGGNYGWNLREGAHDFTGHAAPNLIEPVLDYGRKDGFCVTGGYVYRGKKIRELQGSYIFGDYGSRRIWAIAPGQTTKHEIARSSDAIPSFGEDAEGELYVLGYSGTIFKLEGPEP